MATAKKRAPRKKAPDEETALRQRADRGTNAKVLAENPLLLQALEDNQNDNFAAFKAAKTPEEAWRIKQLFDASEAFQRHIIGYVLSGRDAMQILRQEDTVAETPAETYDFEDYKKRAAEARKQYETAHGGPAA